jgi:transposase
VTPTQAGASQRSPSGRSNRHAPTRGQVDAVIGVGTHRGRHAAALLDPNGGVRATLEVPSDRAGHARLLRLADEQASGRRVWALEGTGCYRAGLTRFLVDQGEWVVEIDRPKRPRGRHGAKSDSLDAVRAGREALARDHLASPRQRGHREALRVLQSPGPPSWPPGRTPAASSRP